MKLIDIYERSDRHELLWRLLSERDPEVNISHRGMPLWDEHVAFTEGKPYEAWYFIMAEELVVGAAYLNKDDTIGVFLFKEWRGKGYGPDAVKAIIEKHGKRIYRANINPKNERSVDMFKKLGFILLQSTYERPLPSRP